MKLPLFQIAACALLQSNEAVTIEDWAAETPATSYKRVKPMGGNVGIPLFFPRDSNIDASEWMKTSECEQAKEDAENREVTSSDDAWENGYASGQNEAQLMWSGDCADSWDYREEVDVLLNCVYKEDSGDNWEKAAFKEGARAGVNAEIEKVEKECLDDSSEQCDKLASAAAGSIARDYCGTSSYSTESHDYQETCRDVAVGECKGMVDDKVEEYCPEKNLSTSDLADLQKECGDEVDKLLGWDMNLRH